MNCRDAQFYLRLRRQSADELGPELAADVDRHLTGCPDCAADALVRAGFDAAVAGAMQAVAIPAGLRERLVANLSAHRGADLRRKAYRTVALAASLFLTVGLAFGAFSASRPKFDTDALVRYTDAVIQSPEESTRAWLVSQKLPPRLPNAFDFDLLSSFGTESVQNRDVPVVIFRERAGPGFAKVYLVRRAGAFDLKGIQAEAQASHCKADVIDDPKQFPNVVYVVVYTGHRLEPFLTTRGNGVALAQ